MECYTVTTFIICWMIIVYLVFPNLLNPQKSAKKIMNEFLENKQHGTHLTFWYANCQTFYKFWLCCVLSWFLKQPIICFFTHPFFIFCIKTALFAFFSFTNSSLKIHAISPKIMLDTLTSFDESLHVWLEPFFGKIHD